MSVAVINSDLKHVFRDLVLCLRHVRSSNHRLQLRANVHVNIQFLFTAVNEIILINV